MDIYLSAFKDLPPTPDLFEAKVSNFPRCHGICHDELYGIPIETNDDDDDGERMSHYNSSNLLGEASEQANKLIGARFVTKTIRLTYRSSPTRCSSSHTLMAKWQKNKQKSEETDSIDMSI
jgi:hypothetical protein